MRHQIGVIKLRFQNGILRSLVAVAILMYAYTNLTGCHLVEGIAEGTLKESRSVKSAINYIFKIDGSDADDRMSLWDKEFRPKTE